MSATAKPKVTMETVTAMNNTLYEKYPTTRIGSTPKIPQRLYERLLPISREWARLLGKGIRSKQRQIHILTPSCCLVGEAHNWSSNYVDCEICLKLSVDVLYMYNGEFGPLEAFCDHWEEAHQ